jgi:hypothetical protein
VVADGHGVIAGAVGGDRVVEGHALVEAGLELGPGQEVIAGGNRHHRARARLASTLTLQLAQLGHKPRHPANVAVGARQQLGLAVVVVQQREREPRRGTVEVSWATAPEGATAMTSAESRATSRTIDRRRV